MTPRSSNINRIKFLHLLISLIGLSLIGIEIYLNSKNASLCKTEACTLVHIFDNYGVLNYIGLAMFFYLFLISILDILNFHLGFFLKLRTYLLFLSVMVEGYFIGFQTWFLNTYCQYCLTIAVLLFLAFFLDYFYPEKEASLLFIKKEKKNQLYKIAILGFASVVFATWLVNVSLKTLDLSLPILIYKEDCIHCKEVISYAKEKNIKIKLYPAKDVIPLMRIVNINSVPLLLEKVGDKILIIKGKKEIEIWFNEKYGKNIKKASLSKKRETDITKKKKAYKTKEEKEVQPEKIRFFIFKQSNSTQFNNTNNTEESGVCTIDKPCE
ncbi:MAG: vitamin K epoxide reductase family protein [Thermodesulfobacterium sp.]|nr:vitamin K epoxide reductase family protein [Thermodesulfobacterium sp.]